MSGDMKRDAFGKRPLYYYLKPDGAIAQSDRVLDLLEKGVPRKLSRQGLMSYLTYGAVVSPLTLIDGVNMLPAGHELANGKATRFWKPDFTPRYDDLAVAQEAVSAAVRAAVERGMGDGHEVSAAFLSGGIDSGAIVAVMRQLHDGEIRTYCVKHDDDSTDESEWARKVAECNGTKHTVLHLSDRMMRDGILKALSSYDQPSIDGLNFWFASKLVREAGEKRILSGEGGDELFAGYDRFLKHMLAYRWAARFEKCGSRLWGGPVGGLLERFAPNEKFRKLGALMAAQCDPYSIPRKVFSAHQVLELLRPELAEVPIDYQASVTSAFAPGRRDLVNRISWLELQNVTTDMWLRDGYQTAAAHGLEIITPLLDRELAELLFRIPGTMKCCPEYLKPLLVRAAGKGLPMDCVTRKKQGFTLPFERYFSGELKDMIDSFLEGRESRLFRPEALRRLGRMYRGGHVNWSRVWVLFAVEYWCRENKVEIGI